MENRLTYLDSAKGIGIILIILGHVLPSNNYIRNWIYSFHVPLFFIISGMLLSYKSSWIYKDKKSIIKNKAKQILYPYATFSMLAIFIMFLQEVIRLLLFNNASFAPILVNVIFTVFLDGYMSLWFLPALFLAELMFIFIYRSKLNKPLILIALVIMEILGCSIVQNNLNSYIFLLLNIITRAGIGTCFIFVGFYIFKYINYIKSKVLYIAIVIYGLINLLTSQMNLPIDLHYSELGNPILYFASSIFGSLFVIITCKYIFGKSKLMQFFGKNSLIIMATHLPLPVLTLLSILINEINISESLHVLFVFVSIIIVEFFIIHFINSYAPFMTKYRSVLPKKYIIKYANFVFKSRV